MRWIISKPNKHHLQVPMRWTHHFQVPFFPFRNDLHHSESRWLATPKRVAICKGPMINLYMGVASHRILSRWYRYTYPNPGVSHSPHPSNLGDGLYGTGDPRRTHRCRWPSKMRSRRWCLKAGSRRVDRGDDRSWWVGWLVLRDGWNDCLG